MASPPTSVPQLRALLEAHGLRAKKSLGQNFLVSESLLKAIVRAADIQPHELVIEVGPGVGTLTYQLALAARHVVAVELDQNMVAILHETLSALENVTIIHEDILRLDIGEVLKREQIKVVANLPYYITSAVIRKFLDHPQKPSVLVLMVQHEVAQRIMAPPGHLSLLALSVQFYATPSLVMKLPAGAFYPSPQVDSAVLRLEVRAARPDVDVEKFFRVAHAGFSQKRKQLRNSLAAGLKISPAESEALLDRAGIDPQRRAQTLTIEEWVRLANLYPLSAGLATTMTR